MRELLHRPLELLRFLRWHFNQSYRTYKISAHHLPHLKTGPGVLVISPHLLTVGEDVYIDTGSYIHCGGLGWSEGQGRITIGHGSYIGPQCILFGMGEIEIGANVMIAPHVVISSVQHPYHDTSKPMYHQPRVYEKIVIEDDVYIASNVVVTPGVRIGRGAVIGAGAVVTHDIEAYSIAVGIPAQVTARREISE